jgi:cytochrome c
VPREHFLIVVLLLWLAACGTEPSASAPSEPSVTPQPASTPREPVATTVAEPRILLFSKTAGFRHDSIPDAIAAIEALGAQHGFAVDATEDAAAFSDEGLAGYRAVVFLMTTGDVLDEAQQAAFERYIRAGNGYAGVHSASDTEYHWPWYGELVGAYFSSHPAIQQARIQIEDGAHPSTAGLPSPWTRTDEWYSFRTNPRAQVHVLATLDESSYQGGTMGADHPIAWYHDYDGGRAWYTAGGHTSASYAEPEFLQHLLGGLRYAMQPSAER